MKTELEFPVWKVWYGNLEWCEGRTPPIAGRYLGYNNPGGYRILDYRGPDWQWRESGVVVAPPDVWARLLGDPRDTNIYRSTPAAPAPTE